MFPEFPVRIAAIFFLSIAPVPALAWGAQGHEIAAAAALDELTPAARAQVGQLLGSPAMMIHDSNWADEIRDRRPQTAAWHFVDIPLEAPGYDPRRDCTGGNCVVAQIEHDRAILADRRRPAPQRADALRFLIHFVADIHQPLHAVDDDDRGGNAIRVSWQGGRATMHHIWDTTVVEGLGFDTAAIAAGLVREPARKAWQSGSAAAWAVESRNVARDEVYALTRGRRTLRLPQGYLRAEAPVARLQLARAAARLAWLLNGALK